MFVLHLFLTWVIATRLFAILLYMGCVTKRADWINYSYKLLFPQGLRGKIPHLVLIEKNTCNLRTTHHGEKNHNKIILNYWNRKKLIYMYKTNFPWNAAGWLVRIESFTCLIRLPAYSTFPATCHLTFPAQHKWGDHKWCSRLPGPSGYHKGGFMAENKGYILCYVTFMAVKKTYLLD